MVTQAIVNQFPPNHIRGVQQIQKESSVVSFSASNPTAVPMEGITTNLEIDDNPPLGD